MYFVGREQTRGVLFNIFNWRRSRRYAYLEYDGLALRLRHFVEDRIHDFQEFVTRQIGRIVLLEVVDEVVQQEICAYMIRNARHTHTNACVVENNR